MSEQTIHSHIWREKAQNDNPYVADKAHCHGYDVYGELIHHASWIEYLYLLFLGEAPTSAQARTLEILAIALANPGPRDASVHAAMSGGVGGSPAASCLMAALAVGAGQYTGAREIFTLMHAWRHNATDLAAWQRWLDNPTQNHLPGDIWPLPEHPPGFDPYGTTLSGIVRDTLDALAAQRMGMTLPWLHKYRAALEQHTQRPLAMTAVAAAALHELGCSPEQGEMLYLLLRLPGAAAHALEQKQLGHKRFPFPAIELLDDPQT